MAVELEDKDPRLANYLKILKLFAKKSIDYDYIDKCGRTGFHFAAAAGNLTGLMFTMKHIEYTSKLYNNQAKFFEIMPRKLVLQRSFGGITPLMKAAEANNYECVQFLLNMGADINMIDNFDRKARNYADRDRLHK